MPITAATSNKVITIIVIFINLNATALQSKRKQVNICIKNNG